MHRVNGRGVRLAHRSRRAARDAPAPSSLLVGGVGVSQVCLRWVLQKGAIMAVGIGANVTKMPTYAAEDLALYGFKLTESDMALLDSIGAEASQVEA